MNTPDGTAIDGRDDSVPTAAGEGGSNPAGSQPVEDSAATTEIAFTSQELAERDKAAHGYEASRARRLEFSRVMAHSPAKAPNVEEQVPATRPEGLHDPQDLLRVVRRWMAAADCHRSCDLVTSAKDDAECTCGRLDIYAAFQDTGEALNPSQNERVKELEGLRDQAFREAAAERITSIHLSDGHRIVRNHDDTAWIVFLPDRSPYMNHLDGKTPYYFQCPLDALYQLQADADDAALNQGEKP